MIQNVWNQIYLNTIFIQNIWKLQTCRKPQWKIRVRHLSSSWLRFYHMYLFLDFIRPFLDYHIFPWYFIIYIPWILSYLSLEVILSFLEILSHISLAGQLPDNGVMGALERGSRGVWYCQENFPPRHPHVYFESK